MKNKIIRTKLTDDGPCICCGSITKHVNYEKLNKANAGRVCDECNTINDSLTLEEKKEVYECPECGILSKPPVKGPGGIKLCSNDFCGQPVQKKD